MRAASLICVASSEVRIDGCCVVVVWGPVWGGGAGRGASRSEGVMLRGAVRCLAWERREMGVWYCIGKGRSVA